MADNDGQIYWYDPDPRAILPINYFHVSRTLRKVVRQGQFEIHFNRNFSDVIRYCAAPAPGREETWINSEIINNYIKLHELGFAHSVETWKEGELVGGLYGVAINGFFAGESMFSKIHDASKVALVYLVNHLRKKGFILLDVQFMTDHLKKFGAIEISRAQYRRQLALAIRTPANFNRLIEA